MDSCKLSISNYKVHNNRFNTAWVHTIDKITLSEFGEEIMEGTAVLHTAESGSLSSLMMVALVHSKSVAKMLLWKYTEINIFCDHMKQNILYGATWWLLLFCFDLQLFLCHKYWQEKKKTFPQMFVSNLIHEQLNACTCI